jgi:hypothetical protein
VQLDHALVHPRHHPMVGPAALMQVSTPVVPVSDHRPLVVRTPSAAPGRMG